MTNLQDIKNRLNNGRTLIEEKIKKEKDREALYQETMGVSVEVNEDKIAEEFYAKIAKDLEKFGKEKGIY
jgi:hypothetical protein